MEGYAKGLLHIGVNVEMSNEQVQIKFCFLWLQIITDNLPDFLKQYFHLI
jgi:hypothetical protein